VVYDLLFRAAAETLLTIAADPKHLGARIGATAVLHSWGSAMTHHPHVHMIVPGGGISLDGARWMRCKPGFLLPVRVLSRLFRRLFLTALADAHAAGRLVFFGEIEGLRRRQAFDAVLAPLKRKRKNWFVYARRPFSGPMICRASARPRSNICRPWKRCADGWRRSTPWRSICLPISSTHASPCRT